MTELTDLDFERKVRAGAKAWKLLLANDPLLRQQANRYAAAKDKLRLGVLAMLDSYHRNEIEEQERDPEPPLDGWEGYKLRNWQFARETVLAEIDNTDNLPVHKRVPENELSAIALWVIGEVYDVLIMDDRAHYYSNEETSS
jgi:hypothetical protein